MTSSHQTSLIKVHNVPRNSADNLLNFVKRTHRFNVGIKFSLIVRFDLIL